MKTIFFILAILSSLFLSYQITKKSETTILLKKTVNDDIIYIEKEKPIIRFQPRGTRDIDAAKIKKLIKEGQLSDKESMFYKKLE